MGLLRKNSWEYFLPKNTVGMADRKMKEFDPLRGRMNQGIWIVLSTGLGSTSLTHQPAAIQKFDPYRGHN